MTSRVFATSVHRLASTTAPIARRSLLASPASLRTMSTAGRKHEFLVVIPDKPGMLKKRLEVRKQHLANVKPQIDSGDWKMGGGLLNAIPESDDSNTWDFAGSTIVAVAESKEQVIEDLKKDIYYTSGVWDVENAQIYPFICAFRNP